MVDLSRTGAGFLTQGREPLQPGREINLRLTHPMVQEGFFSVIDVRRRAQIVCVRPHMGDRIRIGVQFHAPLDYDPAGDE